MKIFITRPKNNKCPKCGGKIINGRCIKCGWQDLRVF